MTGNVKVPDNIEVTCAQCMVRDNDGAMYTHWGNGTCLAGSAEVYTGIMVGARTGVVSGGSQLLCLTSDIGLDEFSTDGQANSEGLYRTEYGADSELPWMSGLDHMDAVCSVCQSALGSWSITIPGSSDCPGAILASPATGDTPAVRARPAFALEYSGYLMSEQNTDNGRSQHICVDAYPEGLSNSEAAGHSATLYPVEVGDSFPGYTDNYEVTCAQCSSNSGPVYVRWGRSDCPAAASLVYSGMAAGPRAATHGGGQDVGGGYNFQCLHNTPLYGDDADPSPGDATDGWSAKLYRVEYATTGQSLWRMWRLHGADMPCAVCQTTGSLSSYMQPGDTSCPGGWSTEYSGFLMASPRGTYRTEYMCVDAEAEAGSGRLVVPGYCRRGGGGFMKLGKHGFMVRSFDVIKP